MQNKKENVPNQHLSDVFNENIVGEKSNTLTDTECKDKTLIPKSIGGIELKDYEEGEYKGLEEYEN
jgi:hypothetical protein